MRSALYYPHTDVNDVNLVKSALLMWDKVEHIVPWSGYRSHYEDARLAKAMELVGAPHVPTAIEKTEAHQRVMEMIESKVPPEFYLKRTTKDHRRYEMYPDKLLPETWDELRQASWAGLLRAKGDYPLMEPAGLTVMSILADCCAGKTKARITDRADAYVSINSLLVDRPLRPSPDLPGEYGMVPFNLQVASIDDLDLEDLIAFREREEKEAGHTLRDLRHRYVDNIDRYLQRIQKEAKSEADVQEIRYQYLDDMRVDIAQLKKELTLARREMLLSKEMLVVLVGGAALLAALAGGVPFELPSVVAPGGAVATLGGMFGAANKYATSRRSVLLKHPMAYMYELHRGR